MTWHSELSPEAARAQREAAGRSAMFLPRMTRTNGLLIIQRPHWGNRRAFVQFMVRDLPGFQFDAKRDWWAAPLTVENYEAAMATGPWNVSEGVREWAREA
jgi:hypothetical protein